MWPRWGGEFGPRFAGKSGPRLAGFRVPGFRVFRFHAGWSLGSTLTGIAGPMWALFGVPGWEELEYQDLRGSWFQVGGICTPKWAGFSVQAGRIACLGPGCLCFPCVPPYGHRLFGYSVCYGGRGGTQGCNSPRMMTGVYVGPQWDRATTSECILPSGHLLLVVVQVATPKSGG